MRHNPALYPFQINAIQTLIQTPTSHLLCIAGTGRGKSRIFQEIAAQPHSRTLIFTPLVALSRQHEEQLLAFGVPPERFKIFNPESLLHPSSYQKLETWRPNFLVVDECHCIWEWGESFRPSFKLLPGLLNRLHIPRSLWLTATLPVPARMELLQAFINENLTLQELGSFEFPAGIQLQVHSVQALTRLRYLLRWVQETSEPGIIFGWTRKNTERLSRLFRESGIRSNPYHAGLSSEERHALEKSLRSGETQVMTATSAFGMGMDFQTLKWVILAGAPPSLLAMTQAIGRVGRQGQMGRAFVLWSPEDFQPWLSMSGGSARAVQSLRRTFEFLRTPGPLRQAYLLEYFNGPTPEKIERRGPATQSPPRSLIQ